MADAVHDVVVVDDADDVRRVVEAQLHLSKHFQVVASGTDGNEAIALVKRHRPSLLLLDASMAELDGLDALPMVQAASPSTRVVMLSGFDGPDVRAAARERGAAGFLNKGVPLEDLPGRLLELLGASAGAADDAEAQPRAPAGLAEGDAVVLARHLERFRTVFDQAAIGMATMTLTGTVVRSNAVLAHLYDLPGDALAGTSYVDLVRADDAEAVRRAIGDAGGGRKRVAELDHHLARPDRLVHSTFAPVADPEGRPLYLFAQAEDITQRRKAAEELRKSEEGFKLLVESVRDYAIFMLDAAGRVQTWNLGAERLKGYRTDEIIGRHFGVFYPSAERAIGHPEHNLGRAAADGRYEEEGWRLRKDGSRFYANVVITALFDAQGNLTGFGKVTRDITDRYRDAEARDRFARELEQANASLQDAADTMASFLAVVAHELRSPIVAVSGAADLLRGHWDELGADGREEMLASIKRGSRQLSGLLEDLLAASRLEAGSFEFTITEVVIAPVVAEVLEELRPTLPWAIEVDCPDDVVARADRDRLGQILVNLLSNAAKYGQTPIRITGRQDGEGCELRVSDAGDGVPAALRPRLFEKFSRASSAGRRGTGLGPFIVRELARGLGGDAWYDASAGSCFAVRLPAPGPLQAVGTHR